MLLYALRLQDQLHGFAVRDRHTPHFHHHLTDARSDWQLVKSDGQLLTINLSHSEDSATIMESYG